MRLDEYISEAISSGRTKSSSADSCPENQRFDTVKNWLEKIGVPFSDYGKFNETNCFYTAGGRNFCIYFPETLKAGRVTFVTKITPAGFVRPLRQERSDKIVAAFNPNSVEDAKIFFNKIFEIATMGNGNVDEAVSSRSKVYAPSKGSDIEEIKEWLDGLGIKGHGWSIYTTYPEKIGELIYMTGPCDTPGHTWISVTNLVYLNGRKVSQRVVLHTKSGSQFITNGLGEEINLSYDDAIDAIEYMVNHPKDYIPVDTDNETIDLHEAISSGRGGKTKYTPQYGCTVEDIVEWAERSGVRYVRKYDGNFHYPVNGEVMCEIGPCSNAKDDTWWVQIVGKSSNGLFMQSVTIQTKIERASTVEIEVFKFKGALGAVPYPDKDRNGIQFDDAIEMARRVIENPNEKVLK